MPAKPETVGLSSERLRRIDEVIQGQYIDRGRLHGALLLVARRGEVAHLGALGMMDAERARPMADDTLFRIYSMPKPLTSTAFMMLVEQGLVALDDPVSRFIPGWDGLGV